MSESYSRIRPIEGVIKRLSNAGRKKQDLSKKDGEHPASQREHPRSQREHPRPQPDQSLPNEDGAGVEPSAPSYPDEKSE